MKFEGGAILKFNFKIPFPYHWQADENQILALSSGGAKHMSD
jgi:hypothetical protein